MSVVTVYHKDIPFDEVMRVHPDTNLSCRGEWESKWRGKPANIEVPAHDPVDVHADRGCKGPFYRVFPHEKSPSGRLICLCPCLAEIGD